VLVFGELASAVLLWMLRLRISGISGSGYWFGIVSFR
jgi:hypothetical protein